MSKFVVAAAATALLVAGAALAQPVLSTTPAALPPTVITVFDQPNFKGRALTFEQSVPSLAKLQFNDVIASVQIKGARDWVLCEHRNFMGKCVRVHMKEKDLKRLKINGQVSSLYPVR
ncbi:MAG: beta/gamma crystallin family protein [Alphaproteobacteria bacterium]|nr:beta/gamma crystallin family protein [Alphaproteobacteria bacterium]